MTYSSSNKLPPTILLIGASRGLGVAMAGEFVTRGWHVVGTVRGHARTKLHDLDDEFEGRVEIEQLNVTESDQIKILRERLSGRRLDMLFVNAGTANQNRDDTLANVSTEDFARVMVTNALAPIRVIEAFQDLVPADGLIGVMSSGQGSISNNENGKHDIYRGSKAALNQNMRSYAACHGDARALVLMAPGWIRTELGGPNAPFSIEESIPLLVDVLLSQRGRPGLRYLDRNGHPVPW